MRKSMVIAAFAAVCASTTTPPVVGHATPSVESVAPLAPAATLPGSVNSSRLVYRSTTVGQAPTSASAAVYFPPGEPPEGGWPVIAWAHGTVGLADDCAYSIAGPGAVERDWGYLDTWLHQGYAIVAADYAGLGTPGEHPYLDGEVEAHNIVDAVTAATEHYPELAKKWVVVGQSQGAGAAMVTAHNATEFGGPGLDYRGAVATGVPAYIEDVVQFLGPGVPPIELGPHTSAYVMYILNGLRTTYPELDIESYLTDSGRYWLAVSRERCVDPLGAQMRAANVVIGDLFAKPLSNIPNVHELLTRYLGLPESGYDKPVFLGQGLRDTDVITPESLRFAATLQADGEPVSVHLYPEDHSGTVAASLPDSLPFVARLFA